MAHGERDWAKQVHFGVGPRLRSTDQLIKKEDTVKKGADVTGGRDYLKTGSWTLAGDDGGGRSRIRRREMLKS